MAQKITSYQTAEFGKFEEIIGSSEYPPVSVTRISYPDTTNAFPSNSAVEPLSSIEIYPKYAVLTKLINPEDIKVSLSAQNINMNLDEIELNTDEIEGLIKQSNTLLDALTAKTNVIDVSNIETKLDVLTSFDYATSAKQDVSNILFDSLTAIQVEKQDQIITLLNSISGYVSDVDISINEIESNVNQVETLLNDLTASNVNVPGFSIPPYDEISFTYVGSTDIFRTVNYLKNSTQVMSLSFTYVTEPPTTGNAIIQSVKKV